MQLTARQHVSQVLFVPSLLNADRAPQLKAHRWALSDMNIDRASAERISVLLESAIREHHESIEIAQRTLTGTEYENFKRGAGMSIAKISYECLDPIYAIYPDLAPPGVL